MVSLSDIPGVVPIADYVWGGAEESDGYSAELCLSEAPFMNNECLSRLIVKILGVLIIVGACFNKTPIMYNMWKSKTGEGLSRAFLYGDVVMYSNTFLYGFLEGHPITAYGENVTLVIQTLIIILMAWHFDPKMTLGRKIQDSAAYVAYMISVTMFFPHEYSYMLMSSTWPILVYSRCSQILETYKVKHTGAQSIITLTMNMGGPITRIITTIGEVGWDIAVLTGFFLSVVLNWAIVVQYFYYKSNTDKFMKEMVEKKEK
jgi:mannose-P-dolichol utilization defect protein 1